MPTTTLGVVAIAVRNVVSMRRLRMSDDLAGGAAAAELLYPGVSGGRITVVILHLRTGMSDDEPNRVLLSSVGAFIRGCSGPVIIRGGGAYDARTAT